MTDLNENKWITLKGTWEYFVKFLKFIQSIICGLHKIIYALIFPLYFIYGFYLMFTKQTIGEDYLFLGLIVVFGEVNDRLKQLTEQRKESSEQLLRTLESIASETLKPKN